MTVASDITGVRRLRRSAARVAGVVGLFFLCYWAAACAMQDTMVFPGHRFPPPATGQPKLLGAGVEPVTHWLEPADGVRVESWLYLPPGATAAQPAPVVLFFHGNGELIDHQFAIIEGYLRLGVGVFLPEWRGYGRSGGAPSQRAIGEDMRAFHAWLVAQPGVDPRRLIYHGRSLGGGVACDLASTHPPAAMVLESSFTSVTALAARMLLPPFLARHPFRNDRVIAQADWPLLIMHGTRDGSIPVSHARLNRAAATRSPKVLYYEFDCDHNELPPSAEQARYWSLVTELVGELPESPR
jgi:fermentation-respiration switch protein FrsA (DUF1100 family)